MIELKNVSFSYGDKEVLNGFSLSIPPQGRIALMGPSGCGKTTLLRLIMGLEKPQGGRLVNRPHPIAAVFQEDRLLRHLTVLENTALAGGDQVKAAEILSELGLGEELESSPASLSGGMRRRVAIARALCTPSHLLILDEPFNGLDEQTKAHAAKVILHHWQGAILAVTHLQEEADLLGATIHKINQQNAV